MGLRYKEFALIMLVIILIKFKEKGVIRESSCTNIPQQNGAAERKNSHLPAINQAFLFQKIIGEKLS